VLLAGPLDVILGAVSTRTGQHRSVPDAVIHPDLRRPTGTTTLFLPPTFEHGYQAFTAWERFFEDAGEPGLPSKLQELCIEVRQITFNPIIPATPFRVRLVGAETQHREIAFVPVRIGNLREIVPHIGGRVRPDQRLAIGEGNDRAQHTLILCMGLTEIEVRHDRFIIGRNAKDFNGTSGPRDA
jgi:hypothetical protein